MDQVKTAIREASQYKQSGFDALQNIFKLKADANRKDINLTGHAVIDKGILEKILQDQRSVEIISSMLNDNNQANRRIGVRIVNSIFENGAQNGLSEQSMNPLRVLMNNARQESKNYFNESAKAFLIEKSQDTSIDSSSDKIIQEVIEAKKEFLEYRGYTRHYLTDARNQFLEKKSEIIKKYKIKDNTDLYKQIQKVESEVYEIMNEIRSLSDNITGASKPGAIAGKLYYDYGSDEKKSVKEYLLELREMNKNFQQNNQQSSQSNISQVSQGKSPANHLKTFLQNKNDNFYAKNVKPLFPIGSESKTNAMSKEDFSKLLNDRNTLKQITQSGNPQMINRIYTFAVENKMFGKTYTEQANFKQFESKILEYNKSNPQNRKYLESSAAVKDRLSSLDKGMKK